MNTRIAFDPRLELNASEFAAAWNASDLAEQGQAQVDESPTESFLPLEITVALISAAVSIPATVIATFIADYLKDRYIDGRKPKVTVTTISTPDGTPLLVVTEEEQQQ